MVPTASHPNWRKLITGELRVEPEFLATKFLLSRLNTVYRMKDPGFTIDSGVLELVQFFQKNKALPKVQSDIKRIFG